MCSQSYKTAGPAGWRRPGPITIGAVMPVELPDTEERLADLAKRKAAESLKPTVAQKPCDTGLFSDQTQQIDLEDLL